MQRWGCLWMVVCLMAVSGCTARTPGQAKGGVAVFFDGMPALQDDGIYFLGERVGTIRSKEVDKAGDSARLTVDLDDAFAKSMGDNLTFYPENGRLVADRLQAIGQPLAADAVLSGFTSGAGLSWFKFRTILSNRTVAARERALRLKNLFGSP